MLLIQYWLSFLFYEEHGKCIEMSSVLFSLSSVFESVRCPEGAGTGIPARYGRGLPKLGLSIHVVPVAVARRSKVQKDMQVEQSRWADLLSKESYQVFKDSRCLSDSESEQAKGRKSEEQEMRVLFAVRDPGCRKKIRGDRPHPEGIGGRPVRQIQNDSGAHPASYPMDTRGSFLGGKAAGA
jgi:hypothetical protein